MNASAVDVVPEFPYIFLFLLNSYFFYLLSWVISSSLSSSSLICCFVSSTLLLSASSEFFISNVAFFISDWFYFTFSSPLLLISLYAFILLPRSVSIFMTFCLNSLSGRLFISVSFGSFPGVLSSSLAWNLFLCRLLLPPSLCF